MSRVAKCCLYNQFKELCVKLGREDLQSIKKYGEAKKAAADFVAAKTAMINKFKQCGYGPWVSKPVEEEMFSSVL